MSEIHRLWPARAQAIQNVEDILGVLKVAIEDYPYSLEVLAVQSGVSISTIYNFLNSKTKSPQLRTVLGCLLALGFKVEIKRAKGKNPEGQFYIKAA